MVVYYFHDNYSSHRLQVYPSVPHARYHILIDFKDQSIPLVNPNCKLLISVPLQLMTIHRSTLGHIPKMRCIYNRIQPLLYFSC